MKTRKRIDGYRIMLNNISHPHHPLRIFWFSTLLTIALAGIVGYCDGIAGLWLFLILVVLEVTFSFDNAVVNSKVLADMSPLWQTIFLTVGIFIAVFVVRFILPVLIVMLAAEISFTEVMQLALNEPEKYGEVLHRASPMIDAFGGAFLVMIGMSYFMDREKHTHWISGLEKSMSMAGRFEHLKVFIMMLTAIVLFLTVDRAYRSTVLVASVLGIALHVGLELFGSMFEKDRHVITQKTGWAAFSSFMYLEVLDASFSFDGVIGAFAITSSVLLIIAGLGAGAVWVRSLTLYLLRTGTLAKYRYLEHGAHWAIMALGIMMMVKLYRVVLPEWMTGSLGLAFIGTAIYSSILEKAGEDD